MAKNIKLHDKLQFKTIKNRLFLCNECVDLDEGSKSIYTWNNDFGDWQFCCNWKTKTNLIKILNEIAL